MKLSDTTIRNAKAEGKATKLFDGGGLFLLVTPSGGKWWRLKYRLDGKEKQLSLGVYPDVGLKEARRRREEARELVASGIDPSEQRKDAKAAIIAEQKELENVFEAVALQWYASYSPSLSPKHAEKLLRYLKTVIPPKISSNFE